MTRQEHLRSRLIQQTNDITLLKNDVEKGMIRQKQLCSQLVRQTDAVARLKYDVEEGMARQEHLRSQLLQQTDEIVQLKYTAEKGMTRQEHLCSQNLQQSNDIAQLKIVVHAMRDGADEKAAEILARLRMGESIEQLCNLLEGRAGVRNQNFFSTLLQTGSYLTSIESTE